MIQLLTFRKTRQVNKLKCTSEHAICKIQWTALTEYRKTWGFQQINCNKNKIKWHQKIHKRARLVSMDTHLTNNTEKCKNNYYKSQDNASLWEEE